MSTKRHFDNPFGDYTSVNTIFEPNSCKLNNKTKEFLFEGFRNLLNHLEKNINKGIDRNDDTVYTGTTGFALLYLQLSRVLNDNNLLDKCLLLTDPIIKKLRPKKDDISFILGDSGVLSIGSVAYHIKGNPSQCNKSLNLLKSMIDFTTDINSQLPDELLYGRSGFLYSLLFVRKLIPNSNQIIGDNDIRSVVNAILQSGQITAKKDKINEKCPLMYYWYKTPYVGAAHGLIGIMALLLEAKNYLTAEELNKLVKPSIDFILSIRLTSGNFPSDLDDFSDVLVHWCHGCPGSVHLFCLAYQMFKDDKYLTAAKDGCECIWKRGLLKKG